MKTNQNEGRYLAGFECDNCGVLVLDLPKSWLVKDDKHYCGVDRSNCREFFEDKDDE